ncbi:MAG: hypothetical protein JW875_01535 [Spirochaetales bacterium]|nr:hypothetical protein [Spirochaetales bacterium]
MVSELADWKTFLMEGNKFHRTAQGSVRRPEVFTPAIIQGIAAMGIEKYFMAIFAHRGMLPRNHTMGDLLEEASDFLSISAETEATLRYMDSLQRICSMDDFSIIDSTKADIPRFLAALDELQTIAESDVPQEP